MKSPISRPHNPLRGDNTVITRRDLGTIAVDAQDEMAAYDSLPSHFRYLYAHNPVKLSAWECLQEALRNPSLTVQDVMNAMNKLNSLELDTSRVSKKRDIPSLQQFLTETKL